VQFADAHLPWHAFLDCFACLVWNFYLTALLASDDMLYLTALLDCSFRMCIDTPPLMLQTVTKSVDMRVTDSGMDLAHFRGQGMLALRGFYNAGLPLSLSLFRSLSLLSICLSVCMWVTVCQSVWSMCMCVCVCACVRSWTYQNWRGGGGMCAIQQGVSLSLLILDKSICRLRLCEYVSCVHLYM